MNNIYTYSLIRALFEQGRDYIDSFWPFVIICVDNNKPILITEVQNKIQTQYGLSIPLHCLNTIITRAARLKMLEQERKSIWLTDKGIEYKKSLELERDVQRRINELTEDAKQYFLREHNVSHSTGEISELIYSFIQENIELSEFFLHPEGFSFEAISSFAGKKQDEKILFDYFIFLEKTKPALYHTLLDIFCGSIISLLLKDSLLANPEKKFDSIYLFFDSNFVLSLLGFHDQENTKLSTELFEIVKRDSRYKLKIFDFTVKEIAFLISGYLNEESRYFSGINIRSIYSQLKNRGWSKVDAIEYLSELENKILALGIEIQPTAIRLNKFVPLRPDERVKIEKYKPEQAPFSQNHDLAVIQKIKEIRGHPIRKIESAIAFFVTSDIRLFHYNMIEWGHSEDKTVAEVISDQILTNLLWLKNPSTLESIKISSIISLHSHDLFIDNEVWQRFLEIVHLLRIKNDIDDKDVALLIYESQIQKVLSEIKPTNTDKISPELVLKHVRLAREQIAHRNLENIERTKTTLTNYYEKAEQERISKIINLIDEITDSINQDAKDNAKRIIKTIRIILAILFGVSLIFVYPTISSQWTLFDPLFWLISAIFFIFNVLGFRIPRKIKLFENLETRIYNNSLKRKLNSSKIQELKKLVPPSTELSEPTLNNK